MCRGLTCRFGANASENGKRRDITDDDLLAVADRFGIGTAKRVIREVREAVRA